MNVFFNVDINLIYVRHIQNILIEQSITKYHPMHLT